MDDDAAALLDDYHGQQSALVSELVRAYFEAGVPDTEQAAVEVRRRRLERKEADLQDELGEIQAELGELEELTDDCEDSSIENVAAELTIHDPDRCTEHNPAIKRHAQKHGFAPSVLAEVVREDANDRLRDNFSTLSKND